jgi:hypothetical protein
MLDLNSEEMSLVVGVLASSSEIKGELKMKLIRQLVQAGGKY